METDRCTFHKRTRRLPRSRQEPQRRAALDRGQAPARRGTTADFTSDAANAAVAASLVSRMAFVFPERVTIWLEAAVAVHCLREVCRPGGIGAARSTANYCSGMAYLRRHLFKKGPNDIDPPGIKEASIIRSSTGRRDQHDGSQPKFVRSWTTSGRQESKSVDHQILGRGHRDQHDGSQPNYSWLNEPDDIGPPGIKKASISRSSAGVIVISIMARRINELIT